MSQTNMYLGISQEKKVTEGIYMRESLGYQVAETAASILHCGSVFVFYPEAEHLILEALRIYGPNVIRFQLVLGWQRWHVGRC